MNKLRKANFRKGKVGLVVVTVFIVLAVFLLTVGVTLIVQVPDLFSKKEAELDSPHMNIAVIGREGIDFSDGIFERVAALDYVGKSVLKEYAMVQDESLFVIGNWSTERVALLNKDQDAEMMPKFVKTADGEGIPLYFNTYCEVQKIVAAGQKIHIKMHGTVYPAYVAGFYENVVNLYSTFDSIYTDEATYLLVKEMQSVDTQVGKVRGRFMELQFNKPYDFALRSQFTKDFEAIYEACRTEFIENLKAESPFPIPEEELKKIMVTSNRYGVEVAEAASEPYMLLLSVMMIVFSFVMTAIALIIINFLIRSGIEDDMRNIGILKGLGYTTKQLRGSYLTLYAIVVAAGSIFGMIAAILIIPVFEQILLFITNLPMRLFANGWAAVGSVALVILVALSAVWYTTRKLKGITPLYALRGAVSSHSFQKNSVPLETTKVGINVTIGLKTVVQNKRQSVMSFLIVLVMTLLTAFSFVMYYNMSVERSTMINLSGLENCDYTIYLNLPNNATQEDYDAIMQQMRDYPGVERLLDGGNGGNPFWINGDNFAVSRFAENYDDYVTNPVYEGRNPRLPTECAVSGDIRNALGLKIGDVVSLSLSEGNNDEQKIVKDFTVVGFIQGLYNQNTVFVTTDGYRSVSTFDNIFRNTSWNVYLEENSKSEFDIMAYRQKITELSNARFPDAENDVKIGLTDQKANIEDRVFKTVSPAATLLLNVILAVTAIVIAAVVFMIIRMKMIREKKNIAISKALGYTSFQIMHQTGLSMLLIALPAALVGGLLGGLLVNPFMNLIGGLLGLYKVGFVVHYGYILLVTVVLAALNYVVALLVSLSTRFITPRMLVAN